MAITAIWKASDRPDRVTSYATNPDKTRNIDFRSPDFRGLITESHQIGISIMISVLK